MNTSDSDIERFANSVYFFRPRYPVDELHDAKINLRYIYKNKEISGVFTLSAWPAPRHPEFIAIVAIGFGESKTYSIHFDETRAASIQKVENPNYAFSADLGHLQSMSQNPEVFEIIAADYKERIREIDADL